MIKRKIIMHITNEKIFIKDKDKVIEEKTHYIKEEEKFESVINGKVYSYTHFLKLLHIIVKKHKLNNSIFNNNIIVIVNSFTSPLEKKAITNAFKILSFNKINIYKESSILKKIIDKNKIVLNIHSGFSEVYYFKSDLRMKKRIKKENFISDKHYLKNLTDLISDTYIKHKNSNPLIIAYGNKKAITKITNIIEKKLKIKVTLFEENAYLINYL